MNSNRQLFNRLTVYVIVFVLVTVSYINFTKTQEGNALDTEPDIVMLDTTKAVEAPSEEEIDELDENMVLGEIDIEDIEEEATEEES